jgi:hypothetical protein
MDNTNNEIFIIITGEYSDMSVHSAWTDEAEANATVLRLNAGYYEDYAHVDSYPLNSVSHDDLDGWKGTYDCAKYGYSVDVKNIHMKRAVIRWWNQPTPMAWTEVASAAGSTEEEVHKKIFDIVAKAAAEKAGL